MKRKLFRGAVAAALAVMLSMPAFAAQMLIPVGEVVGLSLAEGSVTVAAFHETLGGAAREAGIEIGDEIVSIDDRAVDSAADLYEALKCSDGTVTVTLSRQGSEQTLKLCPASTADGPRLGVYVREGVTGIGTVTYYDPDDGTFGALGHGISDSRGCLAPMRSGWVYQAAVASVKKGQVGQPGQLKGSVAAQSPMGSLSANTAFGVFGTGAKWTGEALPVAEKAEIKPGPAQILSNVSGDAVETFAVEIVKCYRNTESTGRDMMIRVTDQRLIDATGGIVAGMSGSPIIQNGKLVGAVTHVLVQDPHTGYGIFMENMLDAAG